MDITQLVPAHTLAATFGVKMMVYGPPGVGKTPALETAQRPVLCAIEPGMRSMARSNIPTWEAYTLPRVNEFFQWLFGSAEAQNFDTVGIDSVSQYAEMELAHRLATNKDGRKAYGEMARTVYTNLEKLYFMKYKHAYLIAKRGLVEDNGAMKARPYFPGQELYVRVPHLYDEILHMEKVPGQGGIMVPMFRTSDNGMVHARDRSGQLLELEPVNIQAICHKAMA